MTTPGRLVCALLCAAWIPAHAGGDRSSSTSRSGDAPILGASAAPGAVVVTLGTGAALLFPHGEVGVRVGAGARAYADLIYRNLTVLGQSGELRVGWGRPIARNLTLGARVRSSITSLALANGVFGVEFSSVPLSNDWNIAGEAALTWTRPGHADVTATLGTSWTLGGARYVTYDDREFQFDPGWRSIEFSVQGEWRMTTRRDLFFRLHGTVLVRGGSIPLGFVPTSTVGVAWRLR